MAIACEIIHKLNPVLAVSSVPVYCTTVHVPGWLMQIVVDASALLAVLLAEAHREGVLAATRGVALCAPASLPWEIGNALSSGLKRGRFPLSVAHAAATGPHPG